MKKLANNGDRWPSKEKNADIVLTRGGTPFNPYDDIWIWTEDVHHVHLDFTKVPLSPALRNSLQKTLAAFAKTCAPGTVRSYFYAFKHFATSRAEEAALHNVSAPDISRYSARLTLKSRPNLGQLSNILQKWVSLGLEGVEPEASIYLLEQRKQGGIKGEPVRTRDPVTGPYSEAEYTALYKAVDAAYGLGQITRWATVLTRLLFACGGRISQYASLKIIDLREDDNKYVLRLPQVKQREVNSREIFKDFDISPQTQQLVKEHISDLLSNGFDIDSALFPERMLFSGPSRQNTRRFTDIFAGHCISDQLSKAFTKELKNIAPPTERLDFAPMPINPRRFRYTFGTRLAEEGASLVVVADRLGHTDLQNVGHYFEASPKIVDNIDRAMDAQLAPLAEAFRGRLIEGEGQSTHKGAPGSRIIDFRVSLEPLASCAGKGRSCSFNKPVACYTCFKFEPWLDAPHEKVLARLESERTRHSGDERIARINDDAIRAVRQVIAECEHVHSQRRGENQDE